MNILFALLPKSQVVYITEDQNVRQCLEKMEYHRYSSLALLNMDGNYLGTITEGDLLWFIKNVAKFDLKVMEKTNILDVKRNRDYSVVNIDSSLDDLVSMSLNQNFVPVVDDKKSFIGIVTRQRIIQYLYSKKV